MDAEFKQIAGRALFLLFLMVTGVALCATALGLDLLIAKGNPLLLIAGLVGIGLARSFRRYGCAHYDFEKLDEAFDRVGLQASMPSTDPILNRRIEELRELEYHISEMRNLDREAQFDPWELQEQRHKIRSLLQNDPRLLEFAHKGVE
jgi:hypothetical protein